MSDTNLVLAVDGGGTKTEAALLDGAGRVLGTGRAGPCQLYRDPRAALAALTAAWHQCCDAAGRRPDPAVTTLSAALAGTSSPAGLAHFVAGTAGFRRTTLCSDVYAALLGAFDAGPGVLVVGGTGSVACRWADGAVTRIGGWGFPHGDAGSGAWLGLRAVGAWLEHRDGMRPPDSLFDSLAKRLPAETGALVDQLRHASPADYAAHVPLLLAAAPYSPLAEALLEEAAGALAALAAALLRPESDRVRPPLPLALGGGVANALAPRIAARLELSAPPRPADPIRGAFLVAAGRAAPDVTLPELALSCA